MNTAPAEPHALELEAARCAQTAGRQTVGRRRCAAGAARAGAAAVNEVVDLLAAGAGATELAAAIDRAAQAARPLVGWPTYEAMTRLLHAARRCARHRAGSHTGQACSDLAEALRSLREALEFDGFLPGPAHPGP
jgi:hypothetical protein